MKASSSSRKKTKDSDDDGKKKKQKKKKDPNAPKRAISAFMFFSQTEREVMEFTHSLFATSSIPCSIILPRCILMNHANSLMQNVKKSNPGIAFTEVGRVLGERWNKLTGISPIFQFYSCFSWLCDCIASYKSQCRRCCFLQRRRRLRTKRKLEQTRNGTVMRSVATRIHS